MGDVALDHLGGGDVAEPAPVTHQHAQLRPALEQAPVQAAADEAAGAGDQDTQASVRA